MEIAIYFLLICDTTYFLVNLERYSIEIKYSINYLFQTNRRCKFKCFYYDNRYDWIKKKNKILLLECKCNSDCRKYNSKQKLNHSKCSCVCKNTKKNYVCENGNWNLDTCTCKNGKYSGSIVSDSVIICDENIKVTKTIPTKTVAAKATSTKSTETNFNKKKVACKIKKFYILPTFLLITISLLIIVSIYGCFGNTNQNKNIYYHITPEIKNEKIYKRRYKKLYILLFPWCHRNKKINRQLYKNILIHYIRYVTIKSLSCIKIISLNPLYLFIDKINGYTEESNGNKYLMLVPTVDSKDTQKSMKNYGAKLEILLDKKLINHTIMIKDIWKSNLIQMKIYC